MHPVAPSRAALMVSKVKAGHRPAVRTSDRYLAQRGLSERQQTCLAHLARDVSRWLTELAALTLGASGASCSSTSTPS
ncbi:hypothetical protein Maq22A_2p42620 (plasmid) [Methylobacterium aquaticum]|uniref:Transposase IS66 n=1 Tax=Methylobacterium aquaticum TaxID=270351 RepID=A0A0C6FT58_9HYPH|nr:hypothetical protein Maq22A_2p42620 [Methylobacterium aquaticum]